MAKEIERKFLVKNMSFKENYTGVLYQQGYLSTDSKAVEYGAAHGALAMTTPGDTSMASIKEVEKLMSGASARVVR
jgi:2-dehydro-3-deoxygluconokinase